MIRKLNSLIIMSVIFTSQVVQKLYGLPLFSFFTDSLHLNKTKHTKKTTLNIKYTVVKKSFFRNQKCKKNVCGSSVFWSCIKACGSPSGSRRSEASSCETQWGKQLVKLSSDWFEASVVLLFIRVCQPAEDCY